MRKKFSSIAIHSCVLAFFCCINMAFAQPIQWKQSNIVENDGKPYNKLRGKWDFYVDGLGEELHNFTMYIGDFIYNEEKGYFLANGCMKSPSQKLSPLALKGELVQESSYNVTITSTVIPDGGDSPFVIQFIGPLKIYGNGVVDDLAGGEGSSIHTEFFLGGSWIGTHHDRRKPNCPPLEIPPLDFQADIRAFHNFYKGELFERFISLDCLTNIVSSGVIVGLPDNTTFLLEPYSDIFSPNVDFISYFRFTDNVNDSDPVTGEPYTFTLLDAIGNEMFSSVKEDIWYGCELSPTKNLKAEITSDNDINISWDEVPLAPGFDPQKDIGFYQVEIFPWPDGGEAIYGASWVGENTHLIPWESFIPPASGYPDGNDMGVSLKNFGNGKYMIRILTNSFPSPESTGVGFECIVTDFAEIILFEKTDSGLTIFPIPE